MAIGYLIQYSSELELGLILKKLSETDSKDSINKSTTTYMFKYSQCDEYLKEELSNSSIRNLLESPLLVNFKVGEGRDLLPTADIFIRIAENEVRIEE